MGRRSIAESPIRGNEYNSFWQDHGRPRTDLQADVADRGSARRTDALHAGRAEGRSALGRPLRRRTVRVVPGSGHRRTLSDRRRHRRDVAGSERRPQPDRAEPRLRDDPSRGVPRPAHHPRGRTSARTTSASGSGTPSAAGKATRWSSIPRTSSTEPTTSGRASGRGPSETLHLVERFTRSRARIRSNTGSPSRIRRRFRGPGRRSIPITRLADDTQIYEYACHEGNQAMPNLLSGGRADAAKRQASSK